MNARRMRILYLHQYFQTREDYGITRSYEVSRHLVRQGHEVTVITGNRSYQSGAVVRRGKGRWLNVESIDGIQVISVEVFFSYRRSFVHRAGAFAVYGLLSLWASLRSGPADIVFATSPPLTAGLAGIVVAFLKRARFVFEVRDLWPEVIEELGVVRSRPVLAALDLMARLSYRCACTIVAVTPGIRRWLVERRGLPQAKVELVTQGADLDLFEGGTRQEARAELGFRDEFIALYAGAMGRANDLSVVVEAAARLPSEIVFLLIGEGMEKAGLQELAERLGARNARFLPGLPRKEVARHLAAADVGLVSLRSLEVFGTALPNKFFDYIAAGLPVVATFPGDLAELVEREGIGVSAGAGDPVRLAGVIADLRADEGRRQTMGRRARELAEGRFCRAAQCEVFERVLLDACSSGGVT